MAQGLERSNMQEFNLSLPARLEAILYLKGKALSLSELAELADASEKEAEQGLLALVALSLNRRRESSHRAERGRSRPAHRDAHVE